MSTFDSTKASLSDLLREIKEGTIQLPDFQRGWIWDDDHIRDLLVSIARSFPIGAVMLLEGRRRGPLSRHDQWKDWRTEFPETRCLRS